jgi:hypothetical protein
LKCIINKYENSIKVSIKIVKKRGGRKRDKRVIEGVNMMKVQYCMYHDENPLYN